MAKYRIFMVGFGGTIHCPFNLGFVNGNEFGFTEDDIREPIYFDTIDQAAEFIRSWITEQNHDYVILPVVSV